MTPEAANRRRFAVLLFLSAPAALAAARADPQAPDDARAHRRVLRNLRGPTSAASLIQVLEATQRERGRVGSASQAGRLSFAPVAGSAWVPLGPTGSSTDDYGTGRITTQTGRVQSIVPHPTNPDIVDVATAGGGVWKTYDASAQSPNGPHWEPVTDLLGTLATGSLAMDPFAPDILYLGMGDPFWQDEPGITTSRDGGATWADLQYLTATYTVGGKQVSRTSLSVRDIKVDPNNSSNVLAGTDVGLFQSVNAGQSWTQVQLNDGTGVNPYEIWSIAWTGGSNWLVAGALPVSTSTKFTYPGNLGLWRSTDGASTWTFAVSSFSVQSNLGRGTFAVAPSTLGDPATARVFLLLGSSDETTDEQRDLLRSDDGGKTFASLSVNSSRAPLNPATPKQADGTPAPAPFQLPDLNLLSAQATYNQSIAVDPRDPDTLFIGGQLSHARSKDGGATWSLMSYGYSFFKTLLPYVHPDNHAMAISSAGVLWLGHDGGLSRSTDAFTAADNGAHYDDAVNQGIVAIEPYSVACAPESWPAELQGFVIGGTQDNGTRVRASNSTLFDDIIGGDGVGVAVSADTAFADDPKSDGKIVPAAILAGNFHTILRSIPGTDYRNPLDITFDLFQDGLGKNLPPELVPFAVDRAATSSQTFLTVTDPPDSAVYRTTGPPATANGRNPREWPNSWEKIVGTVHAADGTTRTTFNPPNPPAVSLRAISAHAKAAGVYGAVSNRYAFATSDGGSNWYVGNYVGSSPSKPDGISRLSGISFDPSDSGFKTFWVSSRAYTMLDGSPIDPGYGHLFKTSDRGVTWTQVVGSAGAALPNVPATSVLFDHGDATGMTVYVATRAGLYRTLDGGQNFARFGSNLPLAEVTGLCLSPLSGHLTASLWGRGFWQLDIAATGNPAGVRGDGDMEHHLRLDGFDLIDLVAVLGASQADARYRPEADMVGTVNQIDDADLTAFLARFGGTP